MNGTCEIQAIMKSQGRFLMRNPDVICENLFPSLPLHLSSPVTATAQSAAAGKGALRDADSALSQTAILMDLTLKQASSGIMTSCTTAGFSLNPPDTICFLSTPLEFLLDSPILYILWLLYTLSP